jgi:glutamyl-tRNA reductase
MDYIGVVGTSFRTASLDELAAANLPTDFRTDSLRELARLSGFSELVYLGTCNRVEFYFRGEQRIHTKELLFHLRHSLADLTGGACQLPEDEKLYVEFGRSAVRHLFRVTSALDSMMVGEAQIAGQAKEAHQKAHDIGLLGGILDQTFHEAFHLAKRIRSETELTRRPVSLVTLVERMIHDHLALSPAPVLILGAGEMARQTLRLIRSCDPARTIVIANRTLSRAEALVHGDAAAAALDLEALVAHPPAAGLVVAATSAEEPVLHRDTLAIIRRSLPAAEPLLVIDLAVPPNVGPRARRLEGVALYTIEEMRAEAERNRQLRSAEVDRCEALLEHQLEVLRRRLIDRELSPVARGLQASFREVAERAVHHALTRELSDLDEAQRQALDRLADGMIERMVQVPLRGLRRAAWNHSSAVISNFILGLEDEGGNGNKGGGTR